MVANCLENLVIVPGYTSELATELLKMFPDTTKIVGTSRRELDLDDIFQLDVTDAVAAREFIASQEVELKKVTLMYCVGTHQIEDAGAGLDPQIWATNYHGFVNLVDPLLERTGGGQLRLLSFGSLSDLYDISAWASTRRSNEERRKYMERLTRTHFNVIGRHFFLPTLLTEANKSERPNGNTEYWLPLYEVRFAVSELLRLPNDYLGKEVGNIPRSVLDRHLKNEAAMLQQHGYERQAT